MNLKEKLLQIQSELKAPKNQWNEFGKYSYRNCEDILEAVKPLCAKHKVVLRLFDEIVMVGNRYYVKAHAVLSDVEKEDEGLVAIDNVAYAREEENKKGMDGSQVTGASSSYARKYALNGLFNIDDTRDSDTTNTGEKGKEKAKHNEELVKKVIKGTSFTLADAEKWANKKYGCAVGELDDAAVNALLSAIKKAIEGE